VSLHECLQDSFISAINFSHLPTEEVCVHAPRNEAVITVAGGVQGCPDSIFAHNPFGFCDWTS